MNHQMHKDTISFHFGKLTLVAADRATLLSIVWSHNCPQTHGDEKGEFILFPSAHRIFLHKEPQNGHLLTVVSVTFCNEQLYCIVVLQFSLFLIRVVFFLYVSFAQQIHFLTHRSATVTDENYYRLITCEDWE